MKLESHFAALRRTKLYPPRLASDVIVRPRLLARLNRLAPLSLIVAPAGYGKTTLVCAWLAQINLSSAWVSLDSEDGDPRLFLANVVAAIRTLFPDFGGSIVERVYDQTVQSMAEAATVLANELEMLDREFVLVLDDYHWIHDAAIHQLLVQLLTHPPRSLHLVITARHDPPFPWALRTRNLFCELRARDLTFTPAETAEFLAKAWDRPVDANLAKALTDQSEGWITSLRLAALSTDDPTNISAWPLLADGSRRSFTDYFASEVIGHLAGDVHDLLVRTSILDTLTGDLCDYVLGAAQGEHHAAAILKQLEQDGVFITTLDREGDWRRLHPLFRSALHQQLQEAASSGEIALLYKRAVTWHESQGLLEEAIGYALAGGQVAAAAEVVGRHRWQLLDDMDFHRLEGWLNQFPPPAANSHIDLLLTKAWLMYMCSERFELRTCLDLGALLLQKSSLEDQRRRECQGEMAALRCVSHLCTADTTAAVQAGQQALELTPNHRFYVRTVATLHICLALHMTGDPAAADSILHAATGERSIARDLALLAAQHIRHSVQLLTADLTTMDAEFPKLLQLATTRKLQTSIAWAHYFWGCTAYLQNQLNSARTHFRAVLELADYANAGAYTHSAIGLALTRQAQGAPEEAASIIETVQSRLYARRLGQMLKVVKAFAAELAARQGRADAAQRWLLEDAKNLDHDATPMFYTPELAAGRVVLATGDHRNVANALTWVGSVLTRAIHTHNIHVQIQALALQAALYEAGGERLQAMAALRQSLRLAQPGGVVRIFADLRVHLTSLLADLHAPEIATDFLLVVRSAIEVELDASTGAGQSPSLMQTAAQGTPQAADASDLHVILTYREMDVLRLLDQRLTNKEIARRLGISTETVRQHTSRLFRKLNVENRRQAVVAARALGFHSDEK